MKFTAKIFLGLHPGFLSRFFKVCLLEACRFGKTCNAFENAAQVDNLPTWLLLVGLKNFFSACSHVQSWDRVQGACRELLSLVKGAEKGSVESLEGLRP